VFDGSAQCQKEAVNILHEIGKNIDVKLQEILKFINEEIDDTIPYGSSSCREWISKTRKWN
jgi:hypothetical protein